MRPLFSGVFCPNDCDLRPVLAAQPVQTTVTVDGVLWSVEFVTNDGWPARGIGWNGWYYPTSSEDGRPTMEDLQACQRSMFNFVSTTTPPGWPGTVFSNAGHPGFVFRRLG